MRGRAKPLAGAGRPESCRIYRDEERVALRRFQPLDNVRNTHNQVSGVNVTRLVRASWFPLPRATGWGHDVRGAESVPEALAVARAFRPEAVIMEIGLPGLNGYEVARRLRGPEADLRPLLVAVTGYGDERARCRSRVAGFDGHLVKPVSPEILYGLLATSRRDRGGT